ncbi:MAG: hypothetical protein QW404_01395 [Candidatus Nanoarchaeia archaeon]
MKTNKVLATAISAFIIGHSAPALSKNPLGSVMEFKNHKKIVYKLGLNNDKSEQLKQNLKGYLSSRSISSVEDAINYSLDFVAKSLDFRWNYFLGKKAGNYFTFPTTVKVTDCRDYAFLFSKTFDYVSKAVGLQDIKCEVVRSNDAYFLGKRIDDHDWVKVTDNKNGKVWLIDPTFYDYGLPHNLEGIVK